MPDVSSNASTASDVQWQLTDVPKPPRFLVRVEVECTTLKQAQDQRGALESSASKRVGSKLVRSSVYDLTNEAASISNLLR